MPWDLNGNPTNSGNSALDITALSFLGSRGPVPLRIKTFADGDADLSPRDTGKDAVFITPNNPDEDRLGSVGIRANKPRSALDVNGAIICGGDGGNETPGTPALLVDSGIVGGRDLNVPWPFVPLVAPVPGELVLGGVRTSIRGFDDPADPGPTVHLGRHWITTNGNESELWMAFGRFARTDLPRIMESAVPWFGPSFDKPSDARLKTNVRQLEGALDKLERIRGVTYESAETESPYALGELAGQPGLGVIAQEVEEVFPEVVTIYEPDQEYRAVDFDGLTSVLIEAVKELKAQNEELWSRIEALERA